MWSRNSIIREYIEKGFSLQYTFEAADAYVFAERLFCLDRK